MPIVSQQNALHSACSRAGGPSEDEQLHSTVRGADEAVVVQRRVLVRPWDNIACHFCFFGRTGAIYANVYPNTAIWQIKKSTS